MNVLIVGGNGGIGLALTKLLADGNEKQLFATYRKKKPIFEHPAVHWICLDASDESQVNSVASGLPKLDAVFVCTGVLHTPNKRPEKSLTEFDPNFFSQNINDNTLPTLLVAKYTATLLKDSLDSVFVTVSARVGSIEDNRLGGWLSYRSSKAALNMAVKTIAIEWSHRLPRCKVIAFHPGTTDTALSQPFQRNVSKEKLFSANFVAERLVYLSQSLNKRHSGGFYDYDGREIAW